MKSPEVLAGAIGALLGLVGLSVRGAKAKFADEVDAKLDKRFIEAEKLLGARNDAINTSIDALKTDVSDLRCDVGDLKVDVRAIAADIRELASRNGYAKGHSAPSVPREG